MGSCLSCPPFTTPSHQEFIVNDFFECALYATQGHRRQMEDKHVISFSLPTHSSYSLFGVFDGFNGDDASTYFAEHIADTLDALDDLDHNDAIINAVLQLDTKYTSNTSDQYNANAGSTFVFAIVNTAYAHDIPVSNTKLAPTNSLTVSCIPHMMSSYASDSQLQTTAEAVMNTSRPKRNCKFAYEALKHDDMPSMSASETMYKVRVFWAGDSRAVLMSESCQFENLTTDHTTQNAKEVERIVNAKGQIINNRINGICEVTRCFGCDTMKNDASLPPNEQKMISVAEHTTSMCTKNDRLLIFCDGLAKKWTDAQLNTRCKHHLMQHTDDDALMYLCEQAMDEGSKDNITVMSIKFK